MFVDVRTEEGHNLRSIKSTNKILNFKNTTYENLHVRSPVITEAPTFLQKPPLNPSHCDCTSSHSFVNASNTDQLLHPQTAEFPCPSCFINFTLYRHLSATTANHSSFIPNTSYIDHISIDQFFSPPPSDVKSPILCNNQTNANFHHVQRRRRLQSDAS